MRYVYLIKTFTFFCAVITTTLLADEHPSDGSDSAIEKEIQIAFEGIKQDGLTLGSDALSDEEKAEEFTVEFDFTYQLDDHFSVFIGGSFFDEKQTIRSSGQSFESSGYERGVTGFAYYWSGDFDLQADIGRLEYSDSHQRWWDDDLDSIRLQLSKANMSFMIASGSEQQPENTDLDFIDPEEKDIKRLLTNLNWEFSPGQQLEFYYLEQKDDSSSQSLNQTLAANKADESDADLHWVGWQYLGEYQAESLGEFEWMVGYTRLSGDETLYEFSDPAGSQISVDYIQKFVVEAKSSEWRFGWTPAALEDWQIIIAQVSGSGDRDLNNFKNTSFRETGLQEDPDGLDYYGEVFQPEISNLRINTLGLKYEFEDDIQLALLWHEYRQLQLDTELRDVSIELDTTGLNRNLGREIDLVANVEAFDGFEFEFVIAEFTAGKAYGLRKGETSRYWKAEVSYGFF